MNNKIKVIDFDECQTWRMKEEGFSGVRNLVRAKEDEVLIIKRRISMYV